LTVTIPIDHDYFIPTTTQLYVLIIGLVLILLLSIYLIHFGRHLKNGDANELPFLTPSEASQLLFGYVNTQVEILYLASQRKARLVIKTDQFTVTLIGSDLGPIGSVLTPTFHRRRTYSGIDLDRRLCRSDVSKQAEKELRKIGYISGNCCIRPSWLVFLIAPFLVLTELLCAYQTIGSPLLLSFLIVMAEVMGRKIFAGCCNHCVHATVIEHFRKQALLFSGIFVVIGFACYFDRPILWDVFQGMIIGGLASTLIEFAFVLRSKWTAEGARVAAELFQYRKKLALEGPENENGKSVLSSGNGILV
jgi:hypothetical protein